MDIIFSHSPPGSSPPGAGRRPAGRRASHGAPFRGPGPSVSGYGEPHGYVLYLLYRGLSVDTEIRMLQLGPRGPRAPASSGQVSAVSMSMPACPAPPSVLGAEQLPARSLLA